MRKLIASLYISLDGFFAGPSGEIDWFVWDEEAVKYSKGLLNVIDTILFGRVTLRHEGLLDGTMRDNTEAGWSTFAKLAESLK
jgi:RibD domain-containing protein